MKDSTKSFLGFLVSFLLIIAIPIACLEYRIYMWEPNYDRIIMDSGFSFKKNPEAIKWEIERSGLIGENVDLVVEFRIDPDDAETALKCKSGKYTLGIPTSRLIFTPPLSPPARLDRVCWREEGGIEWSFYAIYDGMFVFRYIHS